MMKSIRVLLLSAVVQILFGSCLLWKETFLSLRQFFNSHSRSFWILCWN